MLSTRECGEQAGHFPFLGRAAVRAAARLLRWEHGFRSPDETAHSPSSDWAVLQKALRKVEMLMCALVVTQRGFGQPEDASTTIKRTASLPLIQQLRSSITTKTTFSYPHPIVLNTTSRSPVPFVSS